MKFVCVSDLHGELPPIPEADALIIAGDLCPDIRAYGEIDLMKQGQMEWCRTDMAPWEQTLLVDESHMVPGNHDWITGLPSVCLTQFHVDELVIIKGKRVWFTPWVDYCGDWNYQKDRANRELVFDNIPYDLDLLVMHGPAHDVGDVTYSNINAGCYAMRHFIQQRQPRYVVFGHIHEGQRWGREFRLGGSKLYNVAKWGPNWKPLVLDI